MNAHIQKIADGALYAIGFAIIWNLPKIIAFGAAMASKAGAGG